MSHQWTLDQRHALHILATHYNDSSWPNRGAIFNDVFGVNLAYAKVRDEYGGHKNGMRNAPSGIAPTRSLMWNDHACRDEFNLLPYDQQQVQDRRRILQSIQASITRLRLDRNQGLMAINMIPGRIRADNNSPALAAPAAAVANPAPAPASNTTALAGAGGSSSSAAAATTACTDPAQGGRPWYHNQEFIKQGDKFVYRPVEGLSYAVTPTKFYRRPVWFSDTLSMSVQVCDQSVCRVCRHES